MQLLQMDHNLLLPPYLPNQKYLQAKSFKSLSFQPHALFLKNTCCATNITPQDNQGCCRCAHIKLCIILPDLVCWKSEFSRLFQACDGMLLHLHASKAQSQEPSLPFTLGPPPESKETFRKNCVYRPADMLQEWYGGKSLNHAPSKTTCHPNDQIYKSLWSAIWRHHCF